MAETIQSCSAAPVFKRPRLENCDHNPVSEDSYNPKPHYEDLHHNSEAKDVPYEVSSSSDPSTDIYGGDSGFHDLTPPSSAGCIDSTSVDGRQPSLSEQCSDSTNDTHLPEADSSEILFDNQTCGNDALPDSKDENDDADEVASTISDLSGLSDLSDLSGQDWKPEAGPVSWVQRQMNLGADPRAILTELVPKDTIIPPHLNDVTLWKIVVNILSDPPRRSKLAHVNTIDDVVYLLQSCKRILVLTGAGVSVSCGIPDFRSRNGIYARLSIDYPDLPDPQAMFDIHYFKKDPRPFFKFAKEIYPGQFNPSPSHCFIHLLEEKGKLLRNYTQNIDTLEHTAGIKQVITCHGSFATASCTVCHYKVDGSVIRDDIFQQNIPYCPYCPRDGEELGIMKPDIVFFGEGLSDEFHQTMAKDKDQCDLLIVIGSSLKVRPVALIPSSIPPEIPQILINREPLKHMTFDVELLGDCDVIVAELAHRLGDDWSAISNFQVPLQLLTERPPSKNNKFHCHNTNYHKQNSKPSLSEVNNNTDSVVVDSGSSLTGIADTTTDAIKSDEWSCHLPVVNIDANNCTSSYLPTVQAGNKQDGRTEIGEGNPDSTSYEWEGQSFKESEEVKLFWQPRPRETIASRLPEYSFLFIPPNRYIFHGAEVYSDCESEVGSFHEDSQSSPDSSSSLTDDDDADVAVETGCSDEASQGIMDCEGRFSEFLPPDSEVNHPVSSDMDSSSRFSETKISVAQNSLNTTCS